MKKTALLSVLFIMFALFGCKDEGSVLHLVTSLDPLEAEVYIKAFEKDTGIKVKWIRLSSGEVVARFAAEKSRPTQSVWFGGPVFEHTQAAREGFLATYFPAEIGKIEEKWRDRDGYWTGIYIGTLAFATNKEFLEKNRLEPPKTWDDLLKPEFRKKIAVALPYTAGTGYTILGGLIHYMGTEAAFEYYKKLNEQVHHYTKSGLAPVIDAGLGEAAVAVAFSQDIIRKGSERGFPLVMTYPEAVPYEIGGVAIVRGGPEPELAKRFVDWIISLPAQDLMHKWSRIPIRADAQKPAGLKGLDELNTVKMDFKRLGENRTSYLKRWMREFGR